MLQLQNNDGQKFLVMSEEAKNSLNQEQVDNITKMPKPRITVYPGMFIATCGDCLKECYFDYKVLLNTSIRTPLGMVVIIK